MSPAARPGPTCHVARHHCQSIDTLARSSRSSVGFAAGTSVAPYLERIWPTFATGERYERPDSQHHNWYLRGDSNDTRTCACPCTSTGRYRDSLAGTSAVRGDSRLARLLCVERSRQRILLWPSVLGLSKRRLVRRLELEWTVGGYPTHARSGPDSSGSGALLPSPPGRMAGISS